MNVIEINRKHNIHSEYYGIVKLNYDEVVMITNAIYKYNKERNDKYTNALLNKWRNFNDMVCYGGICKYQQDNTPVEDAE